MNMFINNEFKAFEEGRIGDPKELFYFIKSLNKIFDPFSSSSRFFFCRYSNAFIYLQLEKLSQTKDIHNKVYEFYKKVHINKNKIDLTKYYRKNKRYSI